jgi:DNA-binding HxlR family transcriptional regulator
MDIDLLVKVTSRAWSLNILTLMHRGVAGRQAVLLSASGAGRTAFTKSLTYLIELGLMERNPGHGHPLRPEYRLTPLGTQYAARADQITVAARKDSERILVRRAWTVPVLAVSQMPRYFGDIKNDLGAITDRALSQSLQTLHAQQWLTRDIDMNQRPPRPMYSAINAGIKISQAVNLGS